MTKREVIKAVLDGQKPPYVPWSFKFTKEPYDMLRKYYGFHEILSKYKGRLAFYGGLSMQKNITFWY